MLRFTRRFKSNLFLSWKGLQRCLHSREFLLRRSAERRLWCSIGATEREQEEDREKLQLDSEQNDDDPSTETLDCSSWNNHKIWVTDVFCFCLWAYRAHRPAALWSGLVSRILGHLKYNTVKLLIQKQTPLSKRRWLERHCSTGGKKAAGASPTHTPAIIFSAVSCRQRKYPRYPR